MYSMKLNMVLLMFGWLFLSGCQLTDQPMNMATVTPRPTATTRLVSATENSAPAAVSLQPAPRLTAIPTTRPTITPSPTTVPYLTLVVPPTWLELAKKAIGQLDDSDGKSRWQVVAAADPGEVLAGSGADAALIQGNGDISVVEEPLALALPFTTAWESVTEMQAQEMAANGHARVVLVKWDKMPRGFKALRIAGLLPYQAGYPLKESWSLVAAPHVEAELSELAAGLQQALPAKPLVHLAAVGDLMLDRSLGNAIEQGDLAYPFAQVAAQLTAADVSIGNLESSLGDRGEPAQKHYTFRAPPQAAAALALAGFDMVSLANNHSLDYGPDALLQGISLLEAAGIQTAGAGVNSQEARRAKFLTVNGLRLAFLAYANVPVEVGGFDTASWTATADAPGLAWGTVEQIKEDVTAAAGPADLVIVLLHSGLEYVVAPSDPQIAAARAAIEAGATLVIGHHSHILQGIEYYQDGVILYGLGNFAFQIEGDPQTAIFNIWLDENGVRQIEIVPAIIQSGGRPRLAWPDEAQAIRQQVYQLTNLLNLP